jgi:protein-S-isoprenylcysteine O-methyltransferase
LASWQFFKDRIWDEELSLVEFFGQDYIHYQNKVATGLPFIDGFKFDIASMKCN